MNMNLDDALHTFVIEARELLLNMEEALLNIERGEADGDTINAIFRAAHTIKGSAGLFGLDFVVEFTHVAESVLDKVRSKELEMDNTLSALMLEVCDHLGVLMECVAKSEQPTGQANLESKEIAGRLSSYLTPQAEKQVAVPVQHETHVESNGGEGVETDNWHISVRFGHDVMRDGMDPLAFIRYLSTLGRIVNIVTLTEAIPPLSQLDPENCHLGFEIAFKSEADKSAIEGAFEFVRESSRIRILPPHSRLAEYQGFISDLPENEMKLGDILVKCGTLTEAELKLALNIQVHKGVQPIGEVLVEQNMVQPAVVEAALEKQKQVKDHKASEASLIRVDADKLDHHINQLGELIIAGAGLAAKLSGMPDLLEASSVMMRLLEEVRDSALALRMVQIGGTFNRFQRVVRDVSKELGKDIELVISGAETELDKTVVEKIGDPLTHLVRNSMDHGIEPADIRLARGKPAKGTLKLNAHHDAGSIIIEVSDDGGGLNKAKILKKAIEKGLVSEGQTLTDKEIYNLIFEAGFSTAEAVSNLSGRGVGMDVVRRNIQALRGTVDLSSEEGVGSTVRIRLPLTLAIIDGFLLTVGQGSYVIPLDMVEECIEGTTLENTTDERGYLNMRGEVLPIMRLRQYFEVRDEPERFENVVVVRYGEHKAGLVVDKLLGEFQTVIRPLGKVFRKTNGIGGFTILGSGEVALILDVPGLMKQVTKAGAGRDLAAAGARR